MAMHLSAFLTNGGLGVPPVWRLDDDPYCLLGLLPSQRLQRGVAGPTQDGLDAGREYDRGKRLAQ